MAIVERIPPETVSFEVVEGEVTYYSPARPYKLRRVWLKYRDLVFISSYFTLMIALMVFAYLTAPGPSFSEEMTIMFGGGWDALPR